MYTKETRRRKLQICNKIRSCLIHETSRKFQLLTQLNNNGEIKLQLLWPRQLEANISHNGAESAALAAAVLPEKIEPQKAYFRV